ncbi:PAS domain S-box protein [Zunongwangia sp. F363]|uniref:histidine kinase n=1 Tax=Autumnicola tepida TaxID=3075595 RepID=A0ABU3CDG8_9FLAO|nr:PAS domain S-box protein [Zunongwangia sp. F363]MDT0644392.1 PAS domain S-box protein [Zunongwangia sp. F363]
MSIPTKPRQEKSALKSELFELIRSDASIFDFSQNEAKDGMLLVNPSDPKNFWINPKLASGLGFAEHEPTPQNWKDIIFPEDHKKLQNHFQHSTKPFEELIRFQHRTGYTIWFQANFLWIQKENSEKNWILGGFIDVTKFKKPELPLIQTLKRYEHVIEGTNIGTWEWNVQTGETIFSEKWASILGYTLEEIRPTSPDTWKRFAHPEDAKKCEDLFRDHFAGKTEIYESEARMRNKAGEWIWVLDKGKVVSWTADGKPEWMTGFHEEITLRKKEYERNRLFIEQAPSAIAMFDKNMNYIAASQRWLKDYNIQEREVIGKNHYDIFPNISEAWKKVHQECLNGSVIRSDEDSFVSEAGTKHWLSWEVRPWHNDSGEIGGLLMHTEDITRLKDIEKENHERQVLLETILDSIDVGIVSCDKNGKLTLFNRATREWHGIPLKNIEPSEYANYYGLYTADGSRKLEKDEIPLLKVMQKGKVENEEILIKQHSGHSKIVNVNGSQITDNEGEILGAVIAMHDITSRKHTEDQLRISEEAFRGNFENAAVGMAILDPEGNWLEVNKSLCDIIGYSAEELKKLTFQDITHPEDLDADLKLLEELVAGERMYYHMEKRYFHKKGNLVYIILSVSLVRDKNGSPLYFISQITDVTGRKIAERSLKEAVAQLQGVLEASTQVSLISTNTSGIITNFNKGAENLLGYCRNELEGKATPLLLHLPRELKQRKKELQTTTTGESLSGFNILTANAKKGKHDTREWTFVRKDGSRFPVQLTITAIKSNNKIIGYLGAAADISKIKKVEKEMKSLLDVTQEQNQRLKNFAHIVSHNLRSHSGNFGMLLDLYVQDHPEASEDEIIKMLGTASDNLKETVAHLNEVVLMNTKINENLVPINLNEAVEKTFKNVSALAREVDLKIINEVNEDFDILGIPAYLESILLNFITNGIKYRSDERESWIKLSAKREKKFTVLKIEDNGLGIDLKKHGSKLFGMYKTFHHHKEARGIGLFITKNQIEAIGGKIKVESQVNQGTTFKLYLKHEKD